MNHAFVVKPAWNGRFVNEIFLLVTKLVIDPEMDTKKDVLVGCIYQIQKVKI